MESQASSILIACTAEDELLDMQKTIRNYGADAVCRVAFGRISGDHFTTDMPGVTDWERLLDLFKITNAAYAMLPVLEQAHYAPMLSELEELAFIEEALVLKGRLSQQQVATPAPCQ